MRPADHQVGPQATFALGCDFSARSGAHAAPLSLAALWAMASQMRTSFQSVKGGASEPRCFPQANGPDAKSQSVDERGRGQCDPSIISPH